MDKTFAETKGQPPFDWWKALNNPPEHQSEKHLKLIYLSQSWINCACGNQCAIISRDKKGAPKDLLLSALGGQFFGNIFCSNWDDAKETLRLIN